MPDPPYMVQFDESGFFSYSEPLTFSVYCLQRAKAVTISKVITQSRHLFYDDRTSDRLVEEFHAIEEEDPEPTEMLRFRLRIGVIWQVFHRYKLQPHIQKPWL
jgi:hypothetical protein